MEGGFIGEKDNENRKHVLLLICLALVLFSSGCSKKSKYYIEKPKGTEFNGESVTELSNSDVEWIKEFLPMVIEWYNSIDISKEQPIDFVTDEIDVLGNKLYESTAWNRYLNDSTSGNATEDDKKAMKRFTMQI